MADIANTTYIYISTLQAEGTNVAGVNNDNTAGDFILSVPETALVCNQDQYFRFTLMQHSIINQLYNVPSDNNVITYETGGKTTITPGNYTVYQLADLFNAGAATASSVVTCSYNAINNKFTFVNSLLTTKKIYFSHYLGCCFGAWTPLPKAENGQNTLVLQDAYIDVPAGTSFSPSQVEIRALNELVLSVQGLTLGPSTNLNNLKEDYENRYSLKTSGVLAVIPMTAAPGRLNVYENFTLTHSIDVFDTNIQQFGLVTTDRNGAKLADLPHFTCVVRVELMQRVVNEEIGRLNVIAEYLRLLFLSSEAIRAQQAIQSS